MATYDARVGDYGAESAVRRTLKRAGAVIDLTGMDLSATVRSPISGDVDVWDSDAFTIVSAAAGIVDITVPSTDYWTERGQWVLVVEADNGTSVVQSDDVTVSVGPGQSTESVSFDEFDQTITAGTISREGVKLYGEGFYCFVVSTGIYVICTETKYRAETSAAKLSTERAAVFTAWEISQDFSQVSMTWLAPNIYLISGVDVNGAAANGDFAFAIWDSDA